MPEIIEEDAKLDSSPSEDAKLDSSPSEPIETDAELDSSPAIAEESEESDEPIGPSVENQIGELKRRLEASEAEKSRSLAIIEEMSRGPAETSVAVDTYAQDMEALGIEPDVSKVLRADNQKAMKSEIAALREELRPMQDSLILSQERAEVDRLLEKEVPLKQFEGEIFELIEQYRPEVRARMGAAKVASEAANSIYGRHRTELIEADRKETRKKAKSSKRIVGNSLSDASIVSSGPVNELTPEEDAYVKTQQAKGSEMTKEGLIRWKQRKAAEAKKLGLTL